MPESQQITSCYHCGETCKDELIVHDEHSFCCQGCKTVYSLLNETGLVNYYDIEEEAPGKTVSNERSNRDFLDLPEVRDQMIDFREGNKNRTTFYLPSVHCSACIWLLERLDKLNKGIIHSEVNFLRKELTIHFDVDRISLKEVVVLLEDLGYPPDLQKDNRKQANRSESRKLLLKMGVAGFAFGNIMLFSFPEYLSMDDASLDSFSRLFGFLNFALAIPVLLYSSTEYLRSAWKSLRVGYLTIDVPIALGIITLFARSSFEVLSSTGAGYFDSFAGLVFFLLIGKWYQSRTYEALAFDRDFKSYFPIAVSKIVGSEEQVCMLEDIRVGDRLRILGSQIIPADSVLIKGRASVDYSFVNGESELVEKAEGDYLYAGGKQTGGSIEVEVIKEVSQSYLTGLWNQDVFAKEDADMRFSNLIDQVSRIFSIGILSIAAITLCYWLFVDPSEAIDAFTAVLIIACPCALALSMPFAAGNVSRVLGGLGFFVKNTATLEKLAAISDVVFDKTGTLTQSKKARVNFEGETLSEAEIVAIKSATINSTHPLSSAISNHLSGPVRPLSAFEEIPGKGIKAETDGKDLVIGSSAFVMDDLSMIRPTESAQVHVRVGGKYLGRFTVQKEIRKGISELIRSFQASFSLHLLSGDHDGDRTRMNDLFGDKAEVLFNQSPVDKLQYVNGLQASGSSVLMLGDGLNDAGALKQADVGIAVADDVFSFSPACDAILQADHLQDLHSFIHYIKKSLNVVKVSIAISLLYNLVGLFFAVQAQLTPIVAAILMPLSSVTVVAFVSLLTTLLRPKR